MNWIIFGMVIGIIVIVTTVILYITYSIKVSKTENRTKILGTEAEKMINWDLQKWSRKNHGYSFGANLYYYQKNKVFEMDNLIVLKGGLVVVEIKSISGNIIGNGSSLKWTKELRNKSFDIPNPVQQNEKHIKHVMNILPEKLPIISLIIFSNRANDLKITNLPDHVLVTKHINLTQALTKIERALPPNIVKHDYRSTVNLFKRVRNNSLSAKNFHGKIIMENKNKSKQHRKYFAKK